MTRAFLEDYRNLNRQLQQLNNLHRSLLDGAYSRPSQEDSLTGDSTGTAALKRAGVEGVVGTLQASHDEMQKEFDSFVSAIEDPLLRVVITLRYDYALTWSEVAEKTGSNSADSVKQLWLRWAKTHEVQ